MERYLTEYETALSAAPETFSPAMSAVFQAWRKDEGFSCTSFLTLAEDHFAAPSDPAIRRAALVALSFADEESGNGYHNHHHNREVTALTFALLSHHIKHGREPEIGTDMAWLTLIAAAIHDYDHDGIGNRVDGVLHPLRLEQKALDRAGPVLRAAGLDEKDWLKISMMVLPTDVNATALPSPCMQLKEIFRHHAANAPTPLCEISPLFLSFVQCKELTACAAILSDADLGVSAGLDRTIAKINQDGLALETKGAIPATAQSLKGFFDTICKGFPLSPAGKTLLTPGHAAMRKALIAEIDDAPARRFG